MRTEISFSAQWRPGAIRCAPTQTDALARRPVALQMSLHAETAWISLPLRAAAACSKPHEAKRVPRSCVARERAAPDGAQTLQMLLSRTSRVSIRACAQRAGCVRRSQNQAASRPGARCCTPAPRNTRARRPRGAQVRPRAETSSAARPRCVPRRACQAASSSLSRRAGDPPIWSAH